MLMNLAQPYSTRPSKPYDSLLDFDSAQCEDLLFDKQEEVEIRCRAGVRSVSLHWTLSRNLFRQPFLSGDAEALPANRFLIHIPSSKLRPGFFDIHVSLDDGESAPIAGICTFGFKVNEMPLPINRPADFTEFWARAKRELSQIPLAAEQGNVRKFSSAEINAYNLAHASLPADYDPTGHRCEEVEAFKVGFNSVKAMRIRGWLAKPPGSGPFPAMLVLPGAGFNPRPIPLEQARHGFLALDIQVHGQDVDQATYERPPMSLGDKLFDPPDANYNRCIYLNELQGVNYLASRPDVDKTRIVVVGGSQGGGGAVVVAALDPRIAAVVAGIPFFGDRPYVKWSESANAANPPIDGMDRDGPPALPNTSEGRGLPYYDVMNFAPDVRCPTMMNAGLIDPTSSPTSVFVIYRSIGSTDKRFVPLPGLGHDWSAEFDREAWRWLDQVLKLSPKM